MPPSGSHRRHVRVEDLTLPSAPAQTGSRRSSGSRSARRSTSLPSQPPQPAAGGSAASKRKRDVDPDDDPFGDDPFGPQVVDLVDKDDVPPEILGKGQEDEGKKFVRLSALDCVICMDSATDLTVTHCGHLFCSACLHSALTMDGSRSICPICRQRIEKVPASGRFGQRAKGFYPLELKVMTKKTLGRRWDPSSSGTSGGGAAAR